MRRRQSVAALVAVALWGCSGGTSLPDAVSVEVDAPATAAPPPAPECSEAEAAKDATRSYDPLSPMPAPGGAMPSGSKMEEIAQRGRLIVGISGDTLLFGSRNPFTGDLEGFDVDMLKEVALAIFGGRYEDVDDDELIEYRVITYAQRLPALEAGPDNGGVDIVAHTMTINCARWLRIAFSSKYYDAGQKVLVKQDSGFDDVGQLDAANARVCAPLGSTNIDEISDATRYPGLEVVGRADISDCLVALQQGDADAVTGDDTVLAGFVAQDPNTQVVGDTFTKEPYGLGMNVDDIDFVEFVNGVLEDVRSNGRWTEIYEKWLLDTGALDPPAPEPPAAVYGR
ncbi:MAG: glutamate ABC transporter substrate-binding protein [Actinomycetota bacterium]|nr:glutamate ABC transporter substrate-binding protein [Actinomycetota bacterium]